jgi:hypothetical protein
MKQMDIISGVKAEQTLRDAVREHHNFESSQFELELVPFGKKDWIAGRRIIDDIAQADLEKIFRQTHKSLLSLESDQRIRFENLKLYVIPKPVPVFKDPLPNENEVEVEVEEIVIEPETPENNSSICPVCKRSVHKYNLHFDSNNKVTGCFMCGGIPDNF